MSLGVSPSSSSPLTTHSRPLPPGRKRNSYTPSPRATPRLHWNELLPSSSTASEEVSPSSGTRREQDGTMGGLRERSEEELARAGKEDLEIALRKEWQGRERLMLQLEEAENDRRKFEIQHEELVKAISSLQSRTDEAFSEQSRMEADLEERDELLERMRQRVADAEKQARESQKRYVEQEQTFDLERQALQAQEQHLQQRLKSIAVSRRSTTPNVSDVENLASVKDELASLNLSHSTLLAKLNTVTKELHELKIVNQELREENEGWEFLVRERTLNGHVFKGQGGILSQYDEDFDDRDSGSEPPLSAGIDAGEGHKTGLESLDEELEAEMDELHSDLEAQSPIFEDDHAFATNIDGSRKRIGDKDGLLAPPSRRRGRGKKERTVSGGSMADRSGAGLDLAAEMGMADETKSDGGESGVSATAGVESNALRAEVKQLKEANKALTLYCSKIIDRIIAQEGFEHILSVDYKTRRAGTRSTASKSRPALKDMTGTNEWGMTKSSVSEENPSTPADVTVSPEPSKVEKKARPLSMMVRAISGPAPTLQTQTQMLAAVPPPVPQVDAAKEEKTEKRARRGFSLDFRSLGFGSSSSSSSSEPKSALKPLTLSSRSSTTGPSVASSTSAAATSRNSAAASASASASAARKLDIHEEDEEDRKERHRMEATLKLMGIDRKTPPPTVHEEPEEFSMTTGGKEWRSGANSSLSLGRRTASSSSSSNENRRRSILPGSGTTPLARLSSVLGTYEDPLPLDDIVDPHDPAQLSAALQAMDQREAKMREALSRGTAERGYTSPPKIQKGIPGGTGTGGERGRTVSKSESVKTLWSLGGSGDSRPNSGEIVMVDKK
ncbi:hypothetical protein IAT40_006053 [Kwoniella sp. CBS 6097]